MGQSSRSDNLLLVDSNYLVTVIIFKGLLPDVVFFINFSISFFKDIVTEV